MNISPRANLKGATDWRRERQGTMRERAICQYKGEETLQIDVRFRSSSHLRRATASSPLALFLLAKPFLGSSNQLFGNVGNPFHKTCLSTEPLCPTNSTHNVRISADGPGGALISFYWPPERRMSYFGAAFEIAFRRDNERGSTLLSRNAILNVTIIAFVRPESLRGRRNMTIHFTRVW